MNTFLLVVMAAVVGAGGAVAFLYLRRDAGDADLGDEVRRLAERVGSDVAIVAARLEGIDSRLAVSQSTSTDLAHNIFETLGDVRASIATVAEQAREFASLQDLLKAPSARGGLGEALLEELLRQVLPPHAYGRQHRFRSGTIVDAVVKAGGKFVCIDSKFPLTNYRRMNEAPTEIGRAEAATAFAADVSRHIKDISTRYIVPDEGTFEFAVMYVPAEGVYAEVLRSSHRNRSLFELAVEARVVPMSPLTVYGYLQTVMFGLKCLHIESSAREILDFCARLQQDAERFAYEYEVLGRHLGNARSKYEDGFRRLDRFRDQLDRVTDLDTEHRPRLKSVSERGASSFERAGRIAPASPADRA
jgi:DNA recombination protein RmuC